jgi:Na+/melibiose symporter-like transporter
VFVAMYGVMFLITQYFQLVLGYSALSASLRLMPIAMIMLVVAPFTPRLSARFGAHRVVAAGMLLIASGLLLFSGLSTHTPYTYVLVCVIPLTAGIALTMSPMTASIMMAVPARRAGAGSAMNDASRELGAALGIAVLGSIAASHYNAQIGHLLGGLSSADRASARSSIAGALHVAGQLHGAARTALIDGAHEAFVGGLHLAVIVGATLAALSAGIVYRYLPHSLAPTGSMHGPLEAFEEAAELGLGGVPPVFSDEVRGLREHDGAPRTESTPV